MPWVGLREEKLEASWQCRARRCCWWGGAHLRKGASRLMLCQKVDGFRLGSASSKACCWGKLLGGARGFWCTR